MARVLLLAALAGALTATLPAHAQETASPQDIPELDGGPPPLRVPKPPAPKAAAPKPAAPKPAPPRPAPAASSTLKAEQARLATQAAEQKAEQTRLASEAARLKAERDRLEARAAELAAEEQRLAKLRADQEAAYAAKLAALETDRPAAPPPAVAPPPARAPYRAPVARVSYEDARRACTRAGMSEALDRDFDSARYDGAPHWFERERELRGLMRMDDRRGYLLVDTVCELDPTGAVIDFALLR